MVAWKYIGELAAVPAEMLADLIRNPSAAQDALNLKFAADVPAIVEEKLAEAPTVVNAAAAAVGTAVTNADLVTGKDRRVLPKVFAPTETGWYAVPESTGYSDAYVVVLSNRDWYIAGGWTLEGDFAAARIAGSGGGTASGISRTVVPDAIPEWWVGLPQWHLDTIYTGGLGRRGEVLAIDFNARSGPTVAQVATAPVDDHNVPGRCVVPGRGTFLTYTHHGADSLLRAVAAGGTGRADTLTGKTVSTFNMGGAASYSQPYVMAHLRAATTDTFSTFVRVALKWCIRENVADWATNAVTASGSVKQLVEFAEQAYLHTAVAATDGSGNPTKIGIVAGFNPAATRDDVFLLELDLTTGIMHDKMNVAVTQNISSTTPLAWTALTAALPDKPTGTRRLLGLYTGGGTNLWKILTVEYAGAVGADGEIVEHTVNVSTMTVTGTRSYGITGRHFERYPAGAQFDRNGKVWHVNESGNVYTLSFDGVAVSKTTRGQFRPSPVVPIGIQTGEPPIDLTEGDVGSYTDYLAWSDVNLVAIKKGA